MYLRRFRSTNVRDALRAARQELGPDALVLATELVTAGGWRGWLGSREVEITAEGNGPGYHKIFRFMVK